LGGGGPEHEEIHKPISTVSSALAKGRTLLLEHAGKCRVVRSVQYTEMMDATGLCVSHFGGIQMAVETHALI
jgi:hypothetical protein